MVHRISLKPTGSASSIMLVEKKARICAPKTLGTLTRLRTYGNDALYL